MGIQSTKKKVLTKRGVIWLGQTCNLRCHFCYFLDRINSSSHPEHAFMSLDKAKKICSTLVDFYHNNSIDIQGGEPTIYPGIYELITHCRKIGLLPTLITNALVLADIDRCKKILDAGIRDLLVSVQGLGETYDKIVGVPGAYEKQAKALENFQQLGIPIRFNCVLCKMALPQLSDIAKVAIAKNARVVNFIAFNPFCDQASGKRSSENVPRYNEVTPYLNDAMDILAQAGVECNVRYFPFCMVAERHRKSLYNFQQLSYDIHEWDFASWSWTGLTPQRTKDGDVSQPVTLQEATVSPIFLPSTLQHSVGLGRRIANALPIIKKPIRAVYRGMLNWYQKKKRGDSLDSLYRQNARMRAKEHCKYAYGECCATCDVQSICDGFHGDYAELFGAQEATPIKIGKKIDDPQYYIKEQAKIVEEEDHGWAC